MSKQPHHDATSHDRHFFDTFMLVLGILGGVPIVLIFLSRAIAAQTQNEYVLEDTKLQQAKEERLAPVGKVAISGADNSALEPPKEIKVAALVDMSGDQVFNAACKACHGDGIAGAPKMGDKAAWGPRISQGMPMLYEHALKGFQGKSGFMPMKGGRTDLSDKSVTNGVDYMVKAAK